MTDPRPFDDEMAVNRLWNETVAGLPSASSSEIGDLADRSTTETLQRLHALGAAPPPASSRERVRRTLQAHRPPRLDDGESTMTARSVPWPLHPNGRSADMARRAPRAGDGAIRGLPRRLSALAAALLLGIVGAVVLASLIASRDPGPPVDQPVIHAPASPSPAATPEDATLYEITLPADALPAADAPTDNGWVSGLTYDTVPAGVTNREVNAGYPGPFVQHLVSGSITLLIEATVEVVRADGRRETIRADQEVVLDAGDSVVSRSENPVTTTNPGPGPADVIGWHLVLDPFEMTAGRSEMGWLYRDFQATNLVPEMSGEVVIQLRREVLAPDEVILVAPGSLSLAVTADPEVDIFKRFGDGNIYPVESQAVVTVVYAFSMTPQPT